MAAASGGSPSKPSEKPQKRPPLLLTHGPRSQSESLHEARAANQRWRLSTPEAPSALAKNGRFVNLLVASLPPSCPPHIELLQLSYVSLFFDGTLYGVPNATDSFFFLLLVSFPWPFAPLFHRRPPASSSSSAAPLSQPVPQFNSGSELKPYRSLPAPHVHVRPLRAATSESNQIKSNQIWDCADCLVKRGGLFLFFLVFLVLCLLS